MIILTLISVFNLSNQIKNITLNYPLSLSLLDYSNAVVAQDGIHFYDNSFEIENIGKNIAFRIDNNNELETVAMAQFSQENGGYIIILVKNIIYIFDSNKNLLKNETLNGIINGKHYCIIPYKKNNNNLNFIISYADLTEGPKSIILANCIFDISSPDSNLNIVKKSILALNAEGGNASVLQGVYCLLMCPLSSFNINNDLLTCFGGIEWEPKIFSRTFNPENNFVEIESLRSYTTNPIMTYSVVYIEAKTNNKKSKALIYTLFSDLPFWGTFDYTNKFSTIYSENIGSYSGLTHQYWKNKIIYFQ